MIEAIILDVGGVVLPYVPPKEPHDEKWERSLNLEPGTITERIWRHENHRRAYTGELKSSEFEAWIARELGMTSEQAHQWNKDVWAVNPINPQVTDWIRTLRNRCKVAFLSNGWSDDRTRLSENGLLELADLYVNSAEEGILKPNPRIYELTLERLNVSAGGAVFVDDLQENIDAAITLGMRGVLWQSVEQMIMDLEHLLSLTTAQSITEVS